MERSVPGRSKRLPRRCRHIVTTSTGNPAKDFQLVIAPKPMGQPTRKAVASVRHPNGMTNSLLRS